MDKEDSKRLVEQAKQDPEAFGRLYSAFQPRIFNYVAKRIPCRSDAEDVCSLVFEKVLGGIDGFSPTRASFETWLYRIAHNAVVDFYRKKGDGYLSDTEEAGGFYVFNGEPDPEYLREYLRVLGLLNRLNPSYQEVLGLRLIDGMSNSEIAALLGYSQRYVAVKISRALKALRRLAEKEGIIEEMV